MDFAKLEFNTSVKEELSRAVDSGNLPHAVLFTGRNNELRKKLAYQTASALLCSSQKLRPCKKCPSCIKAKSEAHPDIIVTEGTDKKKSIKIDAIRGIRQQAYIFPNESDYKIFIILEAGGMGEEAQNALLKIIEEPPDFTRFILTCTSKDELLPTIHSRLTHYYTGENNADKITAKTQEKITSITSGIVESLTSSREFDLIISTAALEKDRNLFKKCMEELILIFRDALRIDNTESYLSENIAAARKLAKKLTQKEIFKIIENLKILSDDASKNANENLLLTRLAIMFFS